MLAIVRPLVLEDIFIDAPANMPKKQGKSTVCLLDKLMPALLYKLREIGK